MGQYIHVRFAPFFKWYILFKGTFVDAFSQIVMINKSVSFMIKLIEIPYNFSSLSSFLFWVLTSKCNFPITSIFSMSKQNDLVKYWQKTDHIISHHLFVSRLINLKIIVDWRIYVCLVEWCFQYLYTFFWYPFPLPSC